MVVATGAGGGGGFFVNTAAAPPTTTAATTTAATILPLLLGAGSGIAGAIGKPCEGVPAWDERRVLPPLGVNEPECESRPE